MSNLIKCLIIVNNLKPIIFILKYKYIQYVDCNLAGATLAEKYMVSGP